VIFSSSNSFDKVINRTTSNFGFTLFYIHSRSFLAALTYPKMPHTLVTGANSFVAAHIISKLINDGHTVTGSVRRSSAGSAILAGNPSWKGKLSFVEIIDYAETGIWDDVFKAQSFDYIIHVAAPLLDNPANTDYDRDYLRPSVEG
jgi:nucleoside-diphosphate-sugar epimerase